MQAGFRTRHITTVAITTVCRNATHSANLHDNFKIYLIKVRCMTKMIWKYNILNLILIFKFRRMFPLPSFRVFGMELEENYIILMDIVPVDQFRYKFQGASWTIAGRADPEPPQKAFVHPDSPCSGSLWMAKPVSFNRLKLTNHTAEKQGYVSWNAPDNNTSSLISLFLLHYCLNLNLNSTTALIMLM